MTIEFRPKQKDIDPYFIHNGISIPDIEITTESLPSGTPIDKFNPQQDPKSRKYYIQPVVTVHEGKIELRPKAKWSGPTEVFSHPIHNFQLAKNPPEVRLDMKGVMVPGHIYPAPTPQKTP